MNAATAVDELDDFDLYAGQPDEVRAAGYAASAAYLARNGRRVLDVACCRDCDCA